MTHKEKVPMKVHGWSPCLLLVVPALTLVCASACAPSKPGTYKTPEEAIRALHPYEVPEIIALPVLEGHPVPDRPQIVPQVEGARGLYAAENTCHKAG